MPPETPPPIAAGEALDARFFRRPADRVARELLGATLAVGRADGSVRRLPITEVEAYLGAHDLACHGRTGPTRRNATMFGTGGRWYVYLCYGLHWMLNVVTGEEGVPAAVLVRGAGELSGPGRVTRGLGLDRSFDGRPAAPEAGLWIERPAEGHFAWPLPPRWYRRTPRIGVDYAGAWAAKPLRFVVDSPRLPTIMGGRPSARPVRRTTPPRRRN